MTYLDDLTTRRAGSTGGCVLMCAFMMPTRRQASTCSSTSVLACPSTTIASLATIHIFLIAERHDEYFTESLKPTTLRDGRVLAQFAFGTVLHSGVLPRDPRTLDGVDDGACVTFLSSFFLGVH
jgi:hypothetical protein